MTLQAPFICNNRRPRGPGENAGQQAAEARPHEAPRPLVLARSTDAEKQSQLRRLRDFQTRHREAAPEALERLKRAVIDDGNVFAVLMDVVRVCSLGQITHALFEVGGQYRRNM